MNLATLILAAAASAPAPMSCDDIGQEIARTETARLEALEKQNTAWKAVIPFAIVARHASGKAAAEEAGQRLAVLREQYERQGCQVSSVTDAPAAETRLYPASGRMGA
jgi:hypothetical protein